MKTEHNLLKRSNNIVEINTSDTIPCSYCLKIRPRQAKTHTDENCFLLYPEKRPEWFKTDVKTIPVKGHIATMARTSPTPEMTAAQELTAAKEQLNEMQMQLAFLTAQLVSKVDESDNYSTKSLH
jgi:hypothetical protein